MATIALATYFSASPGNVASYSAAHVIGASANALYVVFGFGEQVGADPTFSAITWGGVTMTQVLRVTFAQRTIEIRRLLAPATGSQTFAYTLTSSEYHVFDGFALSGVHQVTPEVSTPTSTGSGTVTSLTVNTLVGGYTVEGCVKDDNLTAFTPDSGQTERRDLDIFATRYGAYDKAGAQTAVSLSWTTVSQWAHGAVGIRAAGNASPGIPWWF